jgi:DNA-binding transcriptional regulator GbsR (MarR family)
MALIDISQEHLTLDEMMTILGNSNASLDLHSKQLKLDHYISNIA